MVVIDVYGKIEKTKISDKLKLYISNIPDEWRDEIIDDMWQEIRQQKIDLEDNQRRYGESFQDEYTLSYLRKIVRLNINNYIEYQLDSIEDCLKCLTNNMIYLFFDYSESDMPFFDWTTNCFDSRFCEEDYAEKVLCFNNFVNENIKNGVRINCIYSSNISPFERTRILGHLSFRNPLISSKCEENNNLIEKLKDMGVRIDKILKCENDYYKLDYIMNGIYNDNSYNQNHFLRTFALLELVLLKPNQITSEIDVLLEPILKNIYEENSKDVATLLRQMRNKIGHGDFKGFNDKAEIFAQKFMKDFWYDYSEYSRLNWILTHTCCLLDDLLRSALFHKLKD